MLNPSALELKKKICEELRITQNNIRLFSKSQLIELLISIQYLKQELLKLQKENKNT